MLQSTMADSSEKCVVKCEPNNTEDKQKGVCRIKAEFIIDDHVRVLSTNCLTEDDKKLANIILKSKDIENSDEPAAKKQKIEADESEEKHDKKLVNIIQTSEDTENFDEPAAKKQKIEPDLSEENGDNKLVNIQKSEDIEDSDEPAAKKIKIGSDSSEENEKSNGKNDNNDEPKHEKNNTDNKKEKFRGQNKARPRPFKAPREQNLCPWLVDQAPGEPEKTCPSKKCSFMHDRKAYLKIKEADIGPECFRFNLTGRCPRGTACRLGTKHLNDEGLNIVDVQKFEEFSKKPPSTKNKLLQPFQERLRKRKINFSKSEKILTKNEAITKLEIAEKKKEREKAEEQQKLANEAEKTENILEKEEPSENKRLGPVVDYDLIKLRLSEKKKIDWRDKLLLSPLTTVGNLPFRRICKEYGADITCGEMALAPNILKGAYEEWALVKRYENEDIFGVQICGNNARVLTRCAQILSEETEIDFVDLNLGCPIDLIYRKGGGSALLTRPNVLQNIVSSVSDVLNIPLTIKTRMGVYSDKPVAHTFASKFRDWGASMITVHGRSREQRYTKSADWNYIEKCAAAANPIPVFGNGDILCYDDYKNVRDNCPSIQGVTIGRGALIKPWIFTEIKEKKLIDISSSERLDILKKYAHYGLDHWGSDTRGVETTRRFMLEWISFLHRYIPVGILENPPQRINERPPYYRGRDEMETMMASSNCGDWIKMTEMFLGKVPDGFHFLPKHKANSWK